MPAIIPPVIVGLDTASQLVSLIGNFSNVASISFNGARYIPTAEVDENTNAKTLMMYKSVDDGVTWAPLDRAHAKTILGSYCYYPQYPQVGGSTVYCAYAVPITGVMHLIQFDLNTETWGITSAGIASGIPAVGMRLTVLSTGTQMFTVAYPAAGGRWKIDAYTYSGAVFTGPVSVFNAITAAISFPSIALDTSDRVFIAWSEPTAGAAKLAVFFGGAVTFGPTDVATSSLAFGPGIYVKSIDSIWFPCDFDPVSGNSVGIMKLTPTAAPVATFEAPVGAANPDIRRLVVNLANKDDTDIFLVWNAAINDGIGDRQIQYTEQRNLTGWGPIKVIWDTLTQPLTPPSPQPGNEEIQIQVGFSGGALNMTVALDQVFDVIGEVGGAIFYLSTATIPPTVTIATGPGGRRPQPFVPNPFDNCLARDFRLYSKIDYARLGCAKLPECFRMDEREWGIYENRRVL